ncbi:uncharacterized protein EMH_0069990 [Eimeria mitis]|uniref:Uncharacterized protein n=1 Tax=Eimeria mitis TaxID=44415 RepID=U6K266_9EIME|nr:uncharacterized protein EMH_0069990 [Eimeria mitis]CDJ31814.1 hypothetical protein EMH_0069990 [Eimeria mitis]
MHEREKAKPKDDGNESADCARLRMALRSKERQLRSLQTELTELKQQHMQVQQQSEKQQQELLKLAQRLEVLRKSKAHFEAKAARTALALDAAYADLRTEREEKAFLLRLVYPHHIEDNMKATNKTHAQSPREEPLLEEPLKNFSEIDPKEDATEQVTDQLCSTQAIEGTKTESDELCSIDECKSTTPPCIFVCLSVDAGC